MAPKRKKRPLVVEEPLEEDDSSPTKKSEAAEVSDNDKENSDNRRGLASQSNVGGSARGGNNNDAAVVASPFRAINPSGRPPEAGVIKQIYVENFMCHRKLRVDLNRNVNFIHGQNGSGKSAILAALQICLGAGARRTHRARNLKELVRKETASGNGPSHAKLRVTLLNGVEGYKHDIYGDTVTVERSIALRGGYNGYKILDCNMVEKSRSKKDLDDMLDMLNIQVENPVSILDQEEAKKFLMGKPEDKYDFFLKATELERIDRNYAATMDKVEDMQTSEEKIRDGLSVLVDKVKELKKKHEQQLALDKLKDKLMELHVKYSWAFYNTIEAEHAAALDAMTKFQEKAAAKQRDLTQAEEAAKTPEDVEATKKQRMDDLVQEAEEQAALKRELETELKKAEAPYKATERHLKNLARERASAGKQLEAAKKRLQEARDQLIAQAGTAEQEHAQRTALLKDKEEELAAAREKVNELKQATSDSLRAYEELEPHVQDARARAERLSAQVNNIKNTLEDLKSSSSDSLALLGPRVGKVTKLVEAAIRAKTFSGKVIGPIGTYIKIVSGKEEFAGIAEVALGHGILDRFIVTNDRDRTLLQKIRKQAGCASDCGIFQTADRPRFRIPDPPAEGIETIASVLNITDDLVFNCLVDNARIDQRALATSKESSERGLLIREGGAFKMRGIINQAYFLPNGDSWTCRNGVLANWANDKKMRNTIGVDKSSAIASAEQELAQLKDEMKEARSDEARLDQQHTKHQRTWNEKKKANQRNDTLIDKLESEIEEIKSDIDSSANVTIDTSEYEEDVSQAEQKVDELKENESKLREQIENGKPEIEDIRKRRDEIKMRNEKVLADLESAEQDMTQFLETQSQKQTQLEKKRKKLEQLQACLVKHREKVDSRANDKDKALMQARELEFQLLVRRAQKEQGNDGVSEEETIRDPTHEELEGIEPRQMDKDAQYFETRMERAREKFNKERERRQVSNSTEDRAQALNDYVKAKHDLDKKMEGIKAVEDNISELQRDLESRRKKWRAFRNHLEEKTNSKFDEMLTLNRYSGELLFDHNDRTLDLKVRKEEAKGKGEAKDVKGLSGGERSFTTISLLLALGENLETPFRVLDEFDVFLDGDTRKLTIKTLVHMAKKMEHRQFIFITPQDISDLKPDPQLKILKLTAPSRHNAVGGASQQTLDFSQS